MSEDSDIQSKVNKAKDEYIEILEKRVVQLERMLVSYFPEPPKEDINKKVKERPRFRTMSEISHELERRSKAKKENIQ